MANGKCRIDGDTLIECLDFGEQFLSDFVDKDDINQGEKAPLRIGIGKNAATGKRGKA